MTPAGITSATGTYYGPAGSALVESDASSVHSTHGLDKQPFVRPSLHILRKFHTLWAYSAGVSMFLSERRRPWVGQSYAPNLPLTSYYAIALCPVHLASVYTGKLSPYVSRRITLQMSCLTHSLTAMYRRRKSAPRYFIRE